MEQVKALAPHFENAVHSLKGTKHITDIRNFGLAAGFTIAALPGEPAKRPYEIAMAMLEEGLLRALRRRHHSAGAALHRRRPRRSTA